MATTLQTSVPLGDATQLAAWLGSLFPHYKTQTRGRKVVVVGSGAATGIGVVIRGPTQVRLNWQFPNMGVQMLLVLAIIFTGLLPGLVGFLVVWLVVKDGVKRIEQDVTAALQGGAAAQPGPPPGYPAQPHAGYAAQPHPGYAAQPQPGYPAQPHPGYPAQPHPGYPAQPHPCYPAGPQHPGYPAGPQHPGYPGSQPPG
jgi:hypothetical protein